MMMNKKEPSTELVVSDMIECDICHKFYKAKIGLAMHKAKTHSKRKTTKAKAAVERKPHEKTAQKVIDAQIDGIPTEIIAYTVGQIEGLVHRIAFENDLPPKHFARRCAEYFSH